jgi:hypothetical protein
MGGFRHFFLVFKVKNWSFARFLSFGVKKMGGNG